MASADRRVPDKAEDYALFLSEALAPYSMRLKGEAAFECDVANLSALTARQLSQYAAVCVLDPTPLGADAWHNLATYAEQGGGVAVFLGRNAKPIESFNDAAAAATAGQARAAVAPAGERELYLAPDNLPRRCWPNSALSSRAFLGTLFRSFGIGNSANLPKALAW